MADSRRIEHVAAAWLARRDAGPWTDQDQQALDAWRDQDTAHRVALLRLESAWHQAGRLQALAAGLPEGEIPPRDQWSAWVAAGAWHASLTAGSAAALVGALMFLFSDSMLALDRFRRPFPHATAWIMSSYFAAQFLIAASLAG